jgi:potassium/hydrogen antiporter
MFWIDQLLLIAGILVILGVLSSKLARGVGVPVLVLFLAVGMLAGSEGIGGITFDDFEIAHAVGTVALGLILYDGGLRTPLRAVMVAWRPAAVMATGGVLLTAGITGLLAAWVLGLPLVYGMLLGSIVASTDAAAVFATLRHQGLHLGERLGATLEVESGSNDPMAVFLTIALIEVILGRLDFGAGMLGSFALQMGVGAIVGLGVGRLGVLLINRINLDAAGLYPVLAGTIGIFTFGAAATLGGSGFLAVYLAGLVIGNADIVFRRGIFIFHDGAAWIAQIVMFVLLGLLSFPSSLAAIAWEGLLLAVGLIFIARPLATFITAAPFRFSLAELTFLSWAGLKGAVPIILAIYPLLMGVPESRLIFDVVFFTVLVSALTQGWSLPYVARRLGLQREGEPEPAVTLEITSLKHVNADIVEYAIPEQCKAAGRRLRDLALPSGVLVAMIIRNENLVPATGTTRLLAGDYVFVVLAPGVRPLVDRVFQERVVASPPAVEPVLFPLRGSATVEDLEDYYGIRINARREDTLADLIVRELGGDVQAGDRVELDGVRLVVQEVTDGQVTIIGLVFLAEG